MGLFSLFSLLKIHGLLLLQTCIYSSVKNLIPCCLAGFLICSQHMGPETHKTEGFSWDKELEKDPLQNLALGIRFQSFNPPGTDIGPESVC